MDCGAPEEVHQFLTQHWSRLMTNIFMAKGNRDPDWQAGWDTMNALLWSLAPKHGRKETTMLLRVLPSLLARLQEGCTALGMPVHERDAFFERLAMLHAAVARAGLQEGEAMAPEPSLAVAMGDRVVDLAALPMTSPPPLPPLGSLEGEGGQRLPDLKVGCRIKLRVGAEDKALRLNWVSPMGGMYLFTNDEGHDALTLTRARLESKFRLGEATLISMS